MIDQLLLVRASQCETTEMAHCIHEGCKKAVNRRNQHMGREHVWESLYAAPKQHNSFSDILLRRGTFLQGKKYTQPADASNVKIYGVLNV